MYNLVNINRPSILF